MDNYQVIKNNKEKDKLIQEIFIDFELHKNNKSGYTLILSIISIVVTYYLNIKIHFGFIILLIMWAIFNFMYSTYKTDILYLAYQALLRYEIREEKIFMKEFARQLDA